MVMIKAINGNKPLTLLLLLILFHFYIFFTNIFFYVRSICLKH